MPDSRKASKRRFGVWLEPEEIAVLKELAVENNTDVTGLLRKIAHGGSVKLPSRKESKNGVC